MDVITEPMKINTKKVDTISIISFGSYNILMHTVALPTLEMKYSHSRKWGYLCFYSIFMGHILVPAETFVTSLCGGL